MSGGIKISEIIDYFFSTLSTFTVVVESEIDPTFLLETLDVAFVVVFFDSSFLQEDNIKTVDTIKRLIKTNFFII